MLRRIKKMSPRLPALLLIAFLGSGAIASAQNLAGRQILEKTIHRKNFSDAELKVKIRKSRAGINKEIVLNLFQKNYPEMTATLAIIQEPEPARGISFLTWDYLAKDKADQKWYYLPAINQYKELNDEQGKKYEDQFGFSMRIFAINLDEADHQLLNEEKINGKPCWKVESVLKNPDSPEGAKAITWVNQQTFAAEKIQAFDKTGKMIRQFDLSEEKKFGDSWQEMAGVYQDLQKGQSVNFQITDANFNSSLSDELFLSTRLKARAEAVSKPK